ncbi:MAG: M56 family metallopeptidase [Cellulosilyticum sp.]|nr:M56 family metallopeptidase [Cellulosilyticum sp.]
MIEAEAIIYWLIISNLMIIITSLIRYLFKRKVGSKWINLLWVIVMIRLLCPIVPSRSFHLMGEQKLNFVLARLVQMDEQESADKIAKQLAQMEDKVARKATQSPEEDVISKKETEALLVEEDAIITEKTRQVNAQIEGNKLYKDLLHIGLAGSCIVGSYFICTYYYLRRRLKQYPIIKQQKVLECLEHIKSELGIRSNLQLIEGTSPMLVGFLKPIIIIPTSYSLEELNLILMHECMHYKRKDQILNILQLVALSIHWYNPLVWLMTKWVQEDREWACDTDVLSRGQNRKQYATLLVRISVQDKKEYYLAQAMKRSSKHLEGRIKSMFEQNQRKKKDVILVGVLAAGIFIYGLTNSENIQGHENSIELTENSVTIAENDVLEINGIKIEQGKGETIMTVDIPTLKRGKNQIIGPFQLQQGDTWEVSLKWEGEGQIYALCQQDPNKPFNDCQCILQMDSPITKQQFTIEQSGEYYFMIGHKNDFLSFKDESELKDIKGEIVVKHRNEAMA